MQQVLFVPTPAFLDHEFLRILEGQEYVMGMNQHSGAKPGQYLQVEVGNVATGGNQMTGVNEQHIVGAQTLRQAGKRQVFNRTLDVFVGAGPDLHPRAGSTQTSLVSIWPSSMARRASRLECPLPISRIVRGRKCRMT